MALSPATQPVKASWVPLALPVGEGLLFSTAFRREAIVIVPVVVPVAVEGSECDFVANCELSPMQ